MYVLHKTKSILYQKRQFENDVKPGTHKQILTDVASAVNFMSFLDTVSGLSRSSMNSKAVA